MAETGHGSVEGCVFCTGSDQRAPLFDTPSLYAMPDKFPMRAGHTLIITKEHISCLATAPTDVLRDLGEAGDESGLEDLPALN